MRIKLSLLLLLISFMTFAQKETKVSGTYTYNAHVGQTLEQAKMLALQYAQAEAMANTFGTHVGMSATSILGNQTNRFMQISDTDVRGVWLKDIESPIFEHGFWEHGFFVTCTVKGLAREISTASIPFKASIMCNGFGKKYERSEFKDGDDLYLAFQSPVSGFLCVYLMDSKMEMNCLLPYYNQTNGLYEIEADKEYRLFSVEEAQGTKDAPYAEGIMLQADGDIEVDVLYVVFSPNRFYKAVDEAGKGNALRHLSFDRFNEWLGRCRRHDTELTVSKYILEIHK